MKPISTHDDNDYNQEQIQKNQQNQKKYMMKMNILLLYHIPAYGITLIGCYYISQLKIDFIKIFPRQCVTHTGRHYPQAILFRFGMISSAFILFLDFFLLFLWIQKQAKRIKFQQSTYNWLNLPTLFGIICQLLTIATIDVGGTWILHRYSAYTFYLFTFSSLVIITLKVFKKMKNQDKSFMSSFSFRTKYAIVLYLIFIYVFAFFGIHYFDTKKKVVGSINQWLSLYALILWWITYVQDWEQLSICLDIQKMEWKIIKQKENIQQNNMECELLTQFNS